MCLQKKMPDWLPLLPQIVSVADAIASGSARLTAANFSGMSNLTLIIHICAAKLVPVVDYGILNDATLELRSRVRHALKEFVPDPDELFVALDSSRGGISGSWLLAFILEPETWTPKDLDVTVAKGQPAAIVEDMLCRAGYTLSNSFDFADREYLGDGHPLRHVYCVTTWTNKDLGRTVDVVHGDTDFAIDVVCGFHSTPVMNILTSTHLVIMHPDLTLRGEAFVYPGTPEHIRVKYTSRGFRLREYNADDLAPCGMACPSLTRGVSIPKTCLSVPLDHRYVTLHPPAVPVYKTWTSPVECTNATCDNNVFVKMGGTF